jgi:fucose 4-O-acetylase-like acetyltransferase
MANKRNVAVDVLKGLAAITVVLSHTFRGKGAVETFIGEIGRWAVPAFFMIQGFYMNLAAQQSWFMLAIKKIKRIYIPFILYSVAYGIYFYIFDGKTFTVFDVVFGKTVVHFYYIIHYMIFSLCLPFLYRLPKRYRNCCLWFMVFSNFAICLALEIQRTYGIRLITYSGFNPTKWWGFVALGMLAAEKHQLFKNLKKHRKGVVLLSACLAMWGILLPFLTDTIGYMYNRYSLFPLSIGITILIIVLFEKKSMPGRNALAYVGRKCFGIYLLHFFIIHILKYIIRLQMLWLVASLTIAICLMVLELNSRLKAALKSRGILEVPQSFEV